MDGGEVVAAAGEDCGDGKVQVVVAGGRQGQPDAMLDDPVEGCCAD